MNSEDITQKIESMVESTKKAGIAPIIFSVIAYCGILSLIPIVLKVRSEYAQFHARQGLALFIAEIIFTLIWVIPFIGWVIGILGWLLCLVLAIIGLINAIIGRKWTIPVLGKFAQKIKI